MALNSTIPHTDGLDAAIKACERKSTLVARLAADDVEHGRKPITFAAVSQWRQIPHERVPQVARVTGVPRWVLRPDLYEHPSVEQRPEVVE